MAISRQRKWQLEQRRKKRCEQCGKKAAKKWGRTLSKCRMCLDHQSAVAQQMRDAKKAK